MHACRYLAEAPEAHTEEFRQALPFMLLVGSSSSGAAGGSGSASAAGPMQFLLPGLLQVCKDQKEGSAAEKECVELDEGSE